ncbi:putative ribonuclease H-like domain-containing protein [Tanacetum coccineum]
MTKTLNEQGFISAVYEGKTPEDLHTGLVTQGHTQEEGIDYDKVFALVARIEEIRLFLAYALFKDFVVYQMDMKSAFMYGKIEEEVYVCQPPGFEDPEFPDRVYKVEKALYGLHQAPRAWYDTPSTYLLDNGFQRGQIDKTLFIKRVKAMETSKPLLKDADPEDVDVYLYRSMIGSLMYLTASRPDIMFAVCACARFQVTPKVSHLHAVKRIFRYLKGQPKLGLWYPKDSPFDLEAYTDSDYAGASLDRKSIIGAEYVAATSFCGQVLWIQNQMLDYGYNFINTKIFIDNESTICIVKNPVFHSKTKHIEIRHHFIRDSNEKKLIQMINPFWQTATTSTLDNREMEIIATIDGKVRIVTEASIRRHLKLEDYDGISNLPTTKFFEQLALMGYVSNSDKLTFQKGHFSPQWRFLIHTILHCLSSKKTAWEQFSSNIATAIICLATNRKFNFSKLIFDGMVKNLDSKHKFLMYPRFIQVFLNKHKRLLLPHKRTYIAPTHTQKLFSNMRRASKGYTGVDIPLFPTMLVQGLIFQGEGSTVLVESHHTPTGAPSTSQPHLSPTLRSSIRQCGVRYGGAATTATGLEAGQSSGNNDKTPTMPHDSPLPRVHTLGSDEGRMQHNELMDLVTKLSNRVVALETDLMQTKKVYGVAFTKLIKKGRKIAQIDEDEGITLVRMGVSTASTDFTTANVPVTTVGAEISTASPEVKTAGDSVNDISVESLVYIKRSAAKTKDKGKGIIEEFKLVMTKTTRQQEQERLGDIQARIEADEELAQMLQAEEREKYSEAEKARLLTELIN